MGRARNVSLVAVVVLVAFSAWGIHLAGLMRRDRVSAEQVQEAIALGSYPEAVDLARRWVAEETAEGGEESAEARRARRSLVEALWRDGRSTSDEALSLAERALAEDERLAGERSLLTASSLQNLGRVLRDREKPVLAEPYLRKALAIREPPANASTDEMVSVLDDLGWTIIMRQPEEGQRLFDRAIAVGEARGGADDPALGDVYAHLGSYARVSANYLEAKTLQERGLAIRERALGPDHPSVALSLRGLGIATHGLADYDGAQDAFERALSILDTRLPDHISTVLTHMSMANLLMDLGDYGRAREHFERCLAASETVQMTDTQLGGILQNFGTLLERSGDYVAARATYERAVELRLKVSASGINSDLLASTRSVFARFLIAAGDMKTAQDILELTLPEQERNAGVAHPNVGSTRQALARLYAFTGRKRDAERMAEGALQTYGAVFGPRHPTLVEPLELLGTLAMESGDLDRARALLERAVSIQMEFRGAKHPLIASSLISLATLNWRAHKVDEAFKGALDAEGIARAHLRRTARVLSEREALRYESIRSSGLDLALTILAADHVRGDLSRSAWDETVRSRALVLDEVAGRHRWSLDQHDAGARALVEALTKARRRLAHLVVVGPDAKRPEEYRHRLSQAVDQVERGERDLAGANESFRHEQTQANAGIDGVTQALPNSTALVAYVQYNHLSESSAEPGVPSYLAFVETRDRRLPLAVPLGGKRELDDLIHRWRAEVAVLPADSSALERYRSAGTELRRRLWDPLAAHLRGSRIVQLVPDGEINLVAFHTLPIDEAGRYLVDSGPSIHYLSAERDLLRPHERHVNAGGLLAVGGPDFDVAPDSSGYRGARSADEHELAADCTSLQSLEFPPIPSTRAEAEEVGTLWARRGRGAVLELTGDRALEGNVKKSVAHRSVIHLATHGFSLENSCASVRNPLLMSGLALAGANHSRETGLREHGEDGILTAEEVASLDLRGVDWVVLSACESGIGRIQVGEGIVGLRRAFEVAGADTLISTLWPVTDHDAREWIRGLYEVRLAGKATVDAVRDASLRILEARRSIGATTHPYFWGAFVAAGDPS